MQVSTWFQSFRYLQCVRLSRPSSHSKPIARDSTPQFADCIDVPTGLVIRSHDHLAAKLPEVGNGQRLKCTLPESDQINLSHQNKLCYRSHRYCWIEHDNQYIACSYSKRGRMVLSTHQNNMRCSTRSSLLWKERKQSWNRLATINIENVNSAKWVSCWRQILARVTQMESKSKMAILLY